jgi:hypothetical protein
MGRIIFGAVVGFIVWTILLLGSDTVWAALSPDWYVKHQTALQEAITNKTPMVADSTILIIAGIRSAILSFITGFLAAVVAKENFKSPLLLGILLLAFGAFIHSLLWNHVPLWYHFLILLPLIPMTLLGGKLKK